MHNASRCTDIFLNYVVLCGGVVDVLDNVLQIIKERYTYKPHAQDIQHTVPSAISSVESVGTAEQQQNHYQHQEQEQDEQEQLKDQQHDRHQDQDINQEQEHEVRINKSAQSNLEEGRVAVLKHKYAQ